jgi:hypothetical protein
MTSIAFFGKTYLRGLPAMPPSRLKRQWFPLLLLNHDRRQEEPPQNDVCISFSDAL